MDAELVPDEQVQDVLLRDEQVREDSAQPPADDSSAERAQVGSGSDRYDCCRDDIQVLGQASELVRDSVVAVQPQRDARSWASWAGLPLVWVARVALHSAGWLGAPYLAWPVSREAPASPWVAWPRLRPDAASALHS